ncbi:MAG: hypothetical protein ACTSRZ_14825 [Promethearchaeota archaeon]
MQEKIELNDSEVINKKLDKLEEFLRDKKIIVGFTGGLNSMVLATLAKRFAKEIKCVFVDARYISHNDRKSIEQMMQDSEINKKIGVIHIIVRQDLSKDILILNPNDRDFFCKKAIIDELEQFRKKIDFDLIIDGTSYDNFIKYWNGKNEFGEYFSFIFGDLELKQDEINIIAEKNNIKRTRPSETNLLSRFSYNIPITPELLENIQESEIFIQDLTKINLVRIRVLDETHVIIEVKKNNLDIILKSEFRTKIHEKISSIGFESVSVDLSGYRKDNLLKIKK